MVIVTDEALNLGHFSSKGNQLKWCVGEHWYKADCLGYEALSEFMVSHLLQKSNIRPVMYDLTPITYNQKNFVGCMSRNFLEQAQELITLQKLYQIHRNTSLVEFLAGMEIEEKIKHVVDFVEETTELTEFGEYLTTLLEIDALFLNEDRHMNNIAVLFNHEKGTYDYCPIFDNGASLFSDIQMTFPLDKDIYQCMEIIKAKPFSPNFEDQVSAAESLYGTQLSVWFGSHDIIALVEQASNYYPVDVLKRVELAVREQLRRYCYLKKKAPLKSAIMDAATTYEQRTAEHVQESVCVAQQVQEAQENNTRSTRS